MHGIADSIALLQPVLVVVGLLGWAISKNRRWLILSGIGLAWFLLDFFIIAAGQLR